MAEHPLAQTLSWWMDACLKLGAPGLSAKERSKLKLKISGYEGFLKRPGVMAENKIYVVGANGYYIGAWPWRKVRVKSVEVLR